MNHWQREFFKTAVANLVESGISVRISQDTLIKAPEGTECSGFFYDKDKALEIAIGDGDWIDLFAHEYSHFQQWKEGLFVDFDPDDLLDKWLSGNVELSTKKVKNFARRHQECELDCEKRTVKLMWIHKLGTNLDEYIQMANAYVLSFNVLTKQRKYPSSELYVPEILRFVPDVWLGDVSDYYVSPPGFNDAVLKYCYGVDR